MEEGKRIRVVFKDDDILSETQKSDGLSRSWVLLKPHQHDTVSDVASHLLHAFQLHQSCPNGLLLSISSFVLPPFESTSILKDNEIIRVQKRKDILTIAADGAANDGEKIEAVEKQPVNTGLLLLANEEFAKEKGSYESDEPEDVSDKDEEEDLLEDVVNTSGGNADQKNRKRKAAEKLQSSKGKKQRSDATGNASNDVHTDKFQNSHQDADLTKKKSISCKEKKDGSIAGGSVENNGEPAKLSDKSDVSGPSMKRTVEVQENNKEIEDAPKETKKVPSRSARRKYAKRRWLREMAKIQKQNATCESEGLRNWKEDHAKADRKKVDGQSKGLQKWKKHQANAERNMVDGQPKGLLHWKLSSQDNWLVKSKKRKERSQNGNFVKLPNGNGDSHEQQKQTADGHEQPTQNSDGLDQLNQKQGDIHEPEKSAVVQECINQNCDAAEPLNQESGEENEVVPIVIRPGHIRFAPLGKEQAVQKDLVPQETYHWNGITSKKKGQQWGKENRPFTPRNDYKTPNQEYSETLSNEKEKQPDEGIDFDKLPTCLGVPKEGDLIAYRILELSSSWTPELSAYRVGKVSWYNAESNQTMLVPVPEYPIVSKKADEDEAVHPDNSLYKEDGSLEIDFSSLVDVRLFNNGRSEPGNGALRSPNEGPIGDVNPPETVLPSSSDKSPVASSPDAIELNQGKETQPLTAETVGVDVWDQVTEALNAKKEQLSKQNGWGSTPKKVQVASENNWGQKPSPRSNWGKSAQNTQPSQDNSRGKQKASPGSNWGKNTQKAQPSQDNSWGKQKASPGSNWGKDTQKAQPSQDNGWGKQSSGSKSWSYKALRGSALGPTMAILRSRKDI